jgi:hypothetical protein
MSKVEITFQPKAAHQKADCINRSSEYNCPNPSTLEAFGGRGNSTVGIRCCTDEHCKAVAKWMAQDYFDEAEGPFPGARGTESMSDRNWLEALKERLGATHPTATVRIEEPGPPPAIGWGGVVRIQEIGLALFISYIPAEMSAVVETPEELDERWALDKHCTTYEDLERTVNDYIARALADPEGLHQAAKEQLATTERLAARFRRNF